jgi:hypothetical protein
LDGTLKAFFPLGKRANWPGLPDMPSPIWSRAAIYRGIIRRTTSHLTSNMLAVSNTSPISNLAIIGRLDLLEFQFPALSIPTAVAGELAAHPDPAARAAIQTAMGGQWIKTRFHKLPRF